MTATGVRVIRFLLIGLLIGGTVLSLNSVILPVEASQTVLPLVEEKNIVKDGWQYKNLRSKPATQQVILAQGCNAVAPTLIAPINDVVSRDLRNPSYTFGIANGITEYIFQIAEDGTFGSPLESDNEFAIGTATEQTFTSFYDLSPNKTYYWRMASVCANGSIGVFSAPARFKSGERVTGAVCELAPPTPSAPINTTVNTLVPNITWQNSSGARELRYQLARDANFTQIEDSVRFIGLTSDPNATITEQPSDNLLPETTYYWRVSSVCAEIDTDGAFGAPVSFTVGSITGPFPSSPTQRVPADNATTGSIRVNVLFDAVAGADYYVVKFYRSLSSAQNDGASSSYFRSSPQATAVFNPNETWYWRVKARNALGWGELSAIRSFRTPIGEASTTITPETGGTLAPAPGFLSVTFPPGAVTASTNVTFRLLSGPSQRLPNLVFANRSFTIEATAGGQPVTDFAQPFTMTLTYDDSDLVAAGITDPNQLNLVFWNGTAWEAILPCSGCSVNTTERTVTVVIDHLTEFALVGPEAAIKVLLPLINN
jgi:hypothetical protein